MRLSLALRHHRFFARDQRESRDIRKGSSTDTSLLVPLPSNIPLTRLKSSRGRRNARPVTLLMRAYLS